MRAPDAPTTTTALLATRNLTKRFGGVTAVDGVDFILGEGELRCLIGPNGAGKSTFFKMLSGQIRPTAGSIVFGGRSIAGMERHRIARAGIGIKTQVPSVFGGLNVRENLKVAARRHRHGGAVAEVVDDIVARLRLTAIVDREVGRLSHGQRQWVELGMVLATAPRLMLLDEPVAGMSEEETEETAALILELRRDAAIVVVDHDISFIRMIGSTVTVFHRGAVLAEGPAKAILEDERVRDVYLGRGTAGDA
jgi:ABC-type uncharacterized transport system ATPase subunit